MKNLFKLVITCAFVSTLVGCASTGAKLEEQGAVPLTQDELNTLLSGRTEMWTKGAGFYANDGTVDSLWDGTRSSGTWEITDAAGQVCLFVEDWGPQGECSTYYYKDQELISVYKGKSKTRPADSYVAGNVLDTL